MQEVMNRLLEGAEEPAKIAFDALQIQHPVPGDTPDRRQVRWNMFIAGWRMCRAYTMDGRAVR